MQALIEALSRQPQGQREELSALRELPKPTGQGAKNMATRIPAGLAGLPVDVAGMLVNALAQQDRPLESYVGSSDWIQRKLGGDPEAPESILGDFLTPDPLDAARAGMNMNDLIQAMTVFHGSPHKWDKVDLSKIGTGEGNQAFGHGFYAAENPGVAKDYQRALGKLGSGQRKHQIKVGDSGWVDNLKEITSRPEMGFDSEFIVDAIKKAEAEGIVPNVKNIKTLLKRRQSGADLHEKKWFDWAIKQVDEFGLDEKTLVGFRDTPRGNLYELDLPDETIDKMLDWDAPLSEQPESVRKAITKLHEETGFMGDAEDAEWVGESGERIYQAARIKLGGPDMSGQRKASETLDSLGIPGIKYLDGTSRRAGEGTRNFVIFDEEAIKPLKRNDELIQAEAG